MPDDVTIDGLEWDGEDWVEPNPEKYWNSEGGYWQDMPPKRGGNSRPPIDFHYPPFVYKPKPDPGLWQYKTTLSNNTKEL